MTTFIDASVLVSILAEEADLLESAERLDATSEPITSAIALWEATVVTARLRRLTIPAARREIDRLVAERDIVVVPVDAAELYEALEAFDRYGKGRSAAGLNLADCFAYACAKSNNATLLYKGNDFAKTDLA